MRFRHFLPESGDEGREIATFGRARLVKKLDGSFELAGGSKDDQMEAREWLSLFMHEAVISEPAGHLEREPTRAGPVNELNRMKRFILAIERFRR